MVSISRILKREFSEAETTKPKSQRLEERLVIKRKTDKDKTDEDTTSHVDNETLGQRDKVN